MIQIELKIGKSKVFIDEKDIIMDNGACVQVLTKKKVEGWDSFPIRMSKKMFGDN